MVGPLVRRAQLLEDAVSNASLGPVLPVSRPEGRRSTLERCPSVVDLEHHRRSSSSLSRRRAFAFRRPASSSLCWCNDTNHAEECMGSGDVRRSHASASSPIVAVSSRRDGPSASSWVVSSDGGWRFCRRGPENGMRAR